jgi:transposase-like protein
MSRYINWLYSAAVPLSKIKEMKTIKNPIADFRKQYGTHELCYQYLADSKWKDGYRCSKCKCEEYRKGNMHLERRCKSCGYNESPLAGTLFHSMKIPLEIAFEMVYRISVNKKGISSIALSREYNVNQKTAYTFKQKVQLCMKSSGNNPLEGIVHIDEFVYGGPDEGCQGRSSESDKLKVCIAVEMVTDKNGHMNAGRMYALPLENYSSDELKKMFDTHISKEAKVVTDKWSGYSPLKKEYQIEQVKSDNGANFPILHSIIMNLKGWIRGIHHSIDKTHLSKYLNEFCFRFNRRNFIDNMHSFILKRMALSKPILIKSINCSQYG